MIESKRPGISRQALESFAERARRASRITGEVNILITGDHQTKRLNRAFRKKNRPTDVLSFPAVNGMVAGDIAISAETAAKNARALGHSLNSELKVLILHGMLHLAGHDHESDSGQMARAERRLRAELGLPQGLIERTRGMGLKMRRTRLRKSATLRRTPA